jgi:iron complex outermembrane recepter protein
VAYATTGKRSTASCIPSARSRQRIPAAEINQTRKWTKTTYKANIAHDIRPENMVYMDHSTGFKSGGFAYGVNATYNPEFLKAREIGTKNRFLDNRLQVNVSAWDYDYTDQVTTIPQFYLDPVLVPVSGTGVANTITTVDAGNSTINVQHIDSKYNKFDLTQLYTQLHHFAWCTAQPYGATPVGGCAGANPEWAGNVTYGHTLHGMGAERNAQLTYHYVGERLNSNQPAPNTSVALYPAILR